MNIHTDKYTNLQKIVRWQKKEFLVNNSWKTIDEIAECIAWSYANFLKDALSQVFKNPRYYITGESRLNNDFQVKKERMDVDKIHTIKEAWEVITIIEDYLSWKLWHFYSEMVWVKRTPLKESYYPHLMTFYYGIVKKYIFDDSEIKEKMMLIQEYCKTWLFSEKAEWALHEFKSLFAMNDDEVYAFFLWEINKIIAHFIDIEECVAVNSLNQSEQVIDPFVNYKSVLKNVKEEIEDNEAKWIINKFDLIRLACFLSALKTPSTKKMIETIKYVSLSKKDFEMYSLCSYHTSDIGKVNHYHYSVWSDVVIAHYNNKPVKAILYVNNKNKTWMLYFDDQHYISLSEQELVEVSSKTDKYLTLVNKIYPESILSEHWSRLNFNQVRSDLTEHWRRLMRENQKMIEDNSGYILTPSKSHFVYFTGVRWNNTKNNSYYVLNKTHDTVVLSIDSYQFTFTQLKNSSLIWKFYDTALSATIFTDNISESLVQWKFLAEKLNQIKQASNQQYTWFYIANTIAYCSKDDIDLLNERHYPSHYYIISALSDKFWKNVIVIFEANEQYFEIIKSE